MKNLLIILGLIASVSSVSANSLIVKSENKALLKVTTAHSNTLDIGDDDIPKDPKNPKGKSGIL